MRTLALLTAAAAVLACGKSKLPACSGVTAACVPLDEGASESKIATAFATAQPGSTIAFGEGTFSFKNSVNLQARNITIKGAGLDKTVLDFTGQTAGSDGLYVGDNSDGVLFVDFTVREARGNAIKVIGTNGVTFRRVKAEWRGADESKHGPYGLYPVGCKNVLVEDSWVVGASDAGIYVGQSQTIVVRRNKVEKNVAGIEIENSWQADVYENDAQDNTAGILVFDLPNLQQKNGNGVRVFKNNLRANNRKNFAAKGQTAVALVPAGTGFFTMANHDVEVFENQFTDNYTGGAAVISYYVSGEDFSSDKDYNPFPRRVYIHDNTFVGNGAKPDEKNALGTLFLLNQSSFTGGVIPSLLFDGILPEASSGENPTEICFKNNGTVTFANLHLDRMDDNLLTLGKIKTEDIGPYTCTLPALPPVVLAAPRDDFAEQG